MLPILLLICCARLPAAAQNIEVKIKLDSSAPEVLKVEGKFLTNSSVINEKDWSFLGSYAGAENLGSRVSALTVVKRGNQPLDVKKMMDGEYLTEEGEAVSWSYLIDLTAPANEKMRAHVSWLEDKQGILMFNDILPQFAAANSQPISATVSFEFPAECHVISSENKRNESVFEVPDIEKAVFLVGNNWRAKSVSNEFGTINLAISGDWKFSDDEVFKTADSILRTYLEIFKTVPNKKIQIAVFPAAEKKGSFGRWEADTRGSTVTMISSDMPFETTSRQLLHEQLRHELFHLWIPNNMRLKGNYAWFYEGFTVYQALKTAVEMNQIRFEDFLATLAEAYNLDAFRDQRISLLESPNNRLTGSGNPAVYSRGMIAAFLCDAALLRGSGGKTSLTNIFQQLNEKHQKPDGIRADGSKAVLEVLANYSELKIVVDKYIKGSEKINWKSDLDAFGIESSEAGFGVKLSVKQKTKGRQKDLLNKLGYNNWRKITRN